MIDHKKKNVLFQDIPRNVKEIIFQNDLNKKNIMKPSWKEGIPALILPDKTTTILKKR